MSATTAPKAEQPSQNISETTECIHGDYVDGEKKQFNGFWRSVQGFVWDDPNKPAYEKKFLLKLDIFLLSYTCLGYFCKNL